MQAVLTVRQIAEEKNVALSTVRVWCETGELLATNIGGRGKRKEWRVAREDLDTFWAARSNVRRRKADEEEIFDFLGS